jgi:hypothetical protein
MKRAFIAAVVAGCLRVAAFGQVDSAEPPLVERQNARPEAAQAQQLRQQITDLYLSDFKNEVELTDDQFLKLNMPLRQFMRTRFQAPADRQALNQRLDQLLSQPNPSEADVQKLTEEIAKHDREVGTVDARFLARFGSELSPRQQLLLQQFNRRFFNEKLPGLISQARERNAAAAAARGQKQRPAAGAAKQNPPRPNATRPNAPVRPENGNALRGGTNRKTR